MAGGRCDADGVGAVGEADSADRFWAADAFGQFAVGDGGAERNLAKSLPNLTLGNDRDRLVFAGRYCLTRSEIAVEVVADGFGKTIAGIFRSGRE